MDLTNEQKCWEIIKGMSVSGPWQAHMVHEAMMKYANNPWININEKHPNDNERVLTWNNKFKEARIQVFNEYYQCWDTEDGDDSEYGLDDGIIQYWMPLPKNPQT